MTKKYNKNSKAKKHQSNTRVFTNTKKCDIIQAIIRQPNNRKRLYK